MVFNGSPQLLWQSATNLNLAESAMMADQAPQEYSPFVNMAGETSTGSVLSRMRQLGWITPAEEAAAREEKIKLGRIKSFQGGASPYVQMQLLRR